MRMLLSSGSIRQASGPLASSLPPCAGPVIEVDAIFFHGVEIDAAPGDLPVTDPEDVHSPHVLSAAIRASDGPVHLGRRCVAVCGDSQGDRGLRVPVSVLVAGADAGSKLEKAQRLKVPVLDEPAFLDLIGNQAQR